MTSGSHEQTAAPVSLWRTRGRRLSAQECWARLRRHREGRLGYLSGRVAVVAHARVSERKDRVVDALPDEHWPGDLPSRLVWLHVDDLWGETEPVAGPAADCGAAR